MSLNLFANYKGRGEGEGGRMAVTLQETTCLPFALEHLVQLSRNKRLLPIKGYIVLLVLGQYSSCF